MTRRLITMSNLEFAKLIVLLNALVPGALLLFDAWRGDLGANPVNYAIRTTGLLALVFLVLCLAVSPLKRLTGYGKLIAFRKSLGLFSFWYALAHFLIFFWWDRSASFSSTLEEMVKRKYLIVGSVGLLILLALAITSPNRMIRALGSTNWKRLHKLVYVAAIAGTIHFYMLVKADTTDPLIFAGIFAVLLLYRVGAVIVDRRARASRKPLAAAA